MAKQASTSWTTKLGGNRTLVFAVIISMLVLFTVASDILPALGIAERGGGEEHVRFTVGGRTVSISGERFQAQLQDWQRYQQGVMFTSGIRRGSTGEFLEDLMTAELARDAGLSIPDAAVREFVRHHRAFMDSRGEFAAKQFDEALNRFYGRMTPRAFEEQVRLHLLVDHFRKVYAASFLQVTDEEIYRKWKSDHPRIAVAYAWAPVAPVREAMKAADLEAGAVEEFWKNSLVQRRHMLATRFAFTAAYIRPSAVDDAAYAKAREETKDDPALRLSETEPYDYWFARREFAFGFKGRTPEQVKGLRAENETRVREEDAKLAAAAPPAPKEQGAPSEPDLYDADPNGLVEREQFRRYWRHRIEKELWLKKVMERVLAEAKEGKGTLEELAAKASRAGVEVRVHAQPEPVDQYGVEKIEGLGGPNCPLRYGINQKGKADEGKVHGELLEGTANADMLDERGWLLFRVDSVVPEQVPALDAVREAVTNELLDQRARDRVRADTEAFRKAAEDSRKGLLAAAKEKGLPAETTEAFHDASWRPPFPRPKPGGTVTPAADRWRDGNRRLASVMSRYGVLRETPPESFASVLDDVEGTGAFYCVQVLRREDPIFEEMTLAQKNLVRRGLNRERMGDLGREMTYRALRERLNLTLGGKPAPDFDERD